MVLFSPASLAAFQLGLGLPIAALFFLLVSRNAGWIFSALAIDYYVLYELFLLAYHLPGEHWIARLPGMAALRRHHVHHHDEGLNEVGILSVLSAKSLSSVQRSPLPRLCKSPILVAAARFRPTLASSRIFRLGRASPVRPARAGHYAGHSPKQSNSVRFS